MEIAPIKEIGLGQGLLFQASALRCFGRERLGEESLERLICRFCASRWLT